MTTRKESEYISAMSRPQVVDSYRQWTELSDEESLLISRFVGDGASVLDLGCGTGRFVEALEAKGCIYLGVDASAEMIDVARSLHPHHSFVVYNLVDHEFDAGDHDVVLLMHNVLDGIHPYDRRRAFLAYCLDRIGDGILVFSSHLTESDPGFVAEEYHGAVVHNFRASHGWHVKELQSIGYQVLLTIECEQQHGRYDWMYFVVRRNRSENHARQP